MPDPTVLPQIATSTVSTDTLNQVSEKLDVLIKAINNPENSVFSLLNDISNKLGSIPVQQTVDNTNLEALLTQILSKLTFLETATLWVIGIGTASVVLYIIYRCIIKFIEF